MAASFWTAEADFAVDIEVAVVVAQHMQQLMLARSVHRVSLKEVAARSFIRFAGLRQLLIPYKDPRSMQHNRPKPRRTA